MGTNFYLFKNVCLSCGREDDPMHIGKSSAGWCFSLHVYPDEGILEGREWRSARSCVGIILVRVEGRFQAYLGPARGYDEKADAREVVLHGARLSSQEARGFFPEIEDGKYGIEDLFELARE